MFSIFFLATDTCKPYSCLRCSEGFDNIVEYKQHRCLITKFWCKYCAMAKASTFKSLLKHQLEHEGLLLSCYCCDAKFGYPSELMDHRFSVSGTKGQRWECHECKVSFENYIDMDLHYCYHRDDKPFYCGHCSELFASSQNYLAHLKGHLADKKKSSFKCEKCLKTFERHVDFRRHKCNRKVLELEIARFKQLPLKENSHKGEESRDSFTLTPDLSSRTTLTQTVRPYRCHECGASFRLKVDWDSHIKIHNPTLECPTCEKVLSSAYHLKKHMEKHAARSRYTCHICDEKFSKIRVFNRHVRSHDPDYKPNKCKDCKRAFHHPWALRMHAKTHERERPHRCTFCRKSYKRYWDLNKHLCDIHWDQLPNRLTVTDVTMYCDAGETNDKETMVRTRISRIERNSSMTEQVRPGIYIYVPGKLSESTSKPV